MCTQSSRIFSAGVRLIFAALNNTHLSQRKIRETLEINSSPGMRYLVQQNSSTFSNWLVFSTIVAGLVYYVIFKRKQRRLEEMIEKFPGPPALPIVGHAHICIGTSKEILKRVSHMFSCESPWRLWLFNKPLVVIYDPKNFQIVANESLEKSSEYKFLKDFLGDGLITINGTKWRQRRRILNPAFNVNILNEYFMGIFHEFNAKLIQSLGKVADTGIEVDLWPFIFKTTSETICVTAMGYRDPNEDENGKRKQVLEYGLVLEKASTIVTERMMKPWLHPNLLFKVHNFITGNNKILQEAYKLPMQIIKINREKLEKENNTNTNNKNNDEDEDEDIMVLRREQKKKKKNRNFIEILLESEKFKDLPEQELTNEVVTFILAGSETSAITVCFTLLMLAMNRSCQDRVYEELKTIFGDSDRPAELEELANLTYMEQCIKETLRRFPPAPIILRNINKDISLSDGRILPAGCSALLPIMSHHLNKDVFPEPGRWDPERFSPEQIEQRHQCSFVPFSTGPRSCIGAKYAMLAVKTQLSIILREYEFCTDMKISHIKLAFDIVLRNRSGYRVYIKRRQK